MTISPDEPADPDLNPTPDPDSAPDLHPSQDPDIAAPDFDDAPEKRAVADT